MKYIAKFPRTHFRPDKTAIKNIKNNPGRPDSTGNFTMYFIL
jgi:hypothetical protein